MEITKTDPQYDPIDQAWYCTATLDGRPTPTWFYADSPSACRAARDHWVHECLVHEARLTPVAESEG